MAWAYRADHANPGVFHLTRDGDVVGAVSLLPEAGWRVELLVDDMVHGLNNPVPLDQRGFGGAAGDMLAKRRVVRDG